MKYRTKLYLLFVGLVAGAGFVASCILYIEMQKVLDRHLRTEVRTVAATGAQFLSAGLVQKIEGRKDVDSAAFRVAVDELRQLRDVNRRSHLQVLYTYVIRPDPQDFRKLVVVIDATEDKSKFAYPGDPYPEGERIGILDHLDEVWSPHHMVSDRWGKYYIAYAPIRNEEGQYVATLGVNLSPVAASMEMSRLKILVSSTFGIAILLSLIAASFLSHGVSRSLASIMEWIAKVKKGHLEARIQLESRDEFGQLSLALNEMAKTVEMHEKLKANFVRYVSQHVMDKILEAEKGPTLTGEEKKITVLFADIRGFSRFAEKFPPDQVVATLNEFFEQMLPVIFRNQGTHDKFTGDGIMVEFGAPLEDTAQEKHAIKAAVEMQQALRQINEKWRKEGRPEMRMGIGIHTGMAIVGNIGSSKRMEYTAIGDTVNIAARLEKASKELGVNILISGSTAKGIGIYEGLKSLGKIKVAGRDEEVEVFGLS